MPSLFNCWIATKKAFRSCGESTSGTLSPSNGRYLTPPTSCARGKVWAKTGTLFDTIALSGLTYGSDHRLKAFAVLVNDRVQSYPPLTTRGYVDRIAATTNGCY